MAPSRTSTVKSKPSKGAANGRMGKKGLNKTQNDGVVKHKKNASKSKAPPLRPNGAPMVKKKPRVYTEKELGIPTLNMITPAGVEKPKGKKKGKVFVDDTESMMTILAIVNAEKEGHIESKMMKARQMEEIREARKAEAEARSEAKKSKLDEAKESVRRKRKRGGSENDSEKLNVKNETVAGTKAVKSKKKSVSFA